MPQDHQRPLRNFQLVVSHWKEHVICGAWNSKDSLFSINRPWTLAGSTAPHKALLQGHYPEGQTLGTQPGRASHDWEKGGWLFNLNHQRQPTQESPRWQRPQGDDDTLFPSASLRAGHDLATKHHQQILIWIVSSMQFQHMWDLHYHTTVKTQNSSIPTNIPCVCAAFFMITPTSCPFFSYL